MISIYPLYLNIERGDVRRQGFTLLELAVVLVVIGIVTTMGLLSTSGVVDAARRTATENKLTQIENALMDYRARFNRLPCPAQYSMNDSNASYGLELTSSDYRCDFTTLGNREFVVEGAVPARTLGLPDEFMLDGWGNKIRYAVDMNATSRDAFLKIKPSDSCGVGVLDGLFYSRSSDINKATKMTITNGARSGTAVIVRGTTDTALRDAQGAVYALISHGPNGHGARPYNGDVINADSSNQAELANCHCTSAAANVTMSGFYVQADTQESATLASNFDDIVRYKERYQMQTPADLDNFGRYLGPELATIDTSGNLKLYRNHCGYWRTMPVTSTGAGFDPTTHVLTTTKNVLFTPKNDLFVYYAAGDACRVYTYGLSATTPTQLTDGVNYGSVTTVSYPSAYSGNKVCDSGSFDNDAIFAMARDNGLLAIAHNEASPYVEFLTFDSATRTYSYGQTALGSFFANNPPSAKPGVISISKDGSYLILKFGASTTNLYRRVGGEKIQYKRLASIPTTSSSSGSYGTVVAASFSSDGVHFALASATTVSIWQIGSTAATKLPVSIDSTGFNSSINSLTFSPDGNYLAVTRNSDGTNFRDNIRIYRVAYDADASISALDEALGATATAVAPGPTESAGSSVSSYASIATGNAPAYAVFTARSDYLIAPLPSSPRDYWPITILQRVGGIGDYSFQPQYINDMSAFFGYSAGAAVAGTAVSKVAVSN